MIEDEAQSLPWSRVKERISVTLWTSFLAASLETAGFFAFLDPLVLRQDGSMPTWITGRPAAYAAGFFFFWLFTFAGSTLTAYMLGSSRNAQNDSDRS